MTKTTPKVATKTLAVLGLSLVTGCAAVPPAGPSIAAMPGPGKTFDQFRAEDANCRGYAMQANAGAPGQAQAASQNSVGAAVGGAALGAATGALVGAASGGPGVGAALGAGVGLLAGSAVGADGAAATSAGLQNAVDVAYAQCMAAAGDKVPVPGPAYAAPAYATTAPGYVVPYPAPYVGPYVGPYVVAGPAVVIGPRYGYGYGYRRFW